MDVERGVGPQPNNPGTCAHIGPCPIQCSRDFHKIPSSYQNAALPLFAAASVVDCVTDIKPLTMKVKPQQQVNDDISCDGQSETSDSSEMSRYAGLVRLFAGNDNSQQHPSTLSQSDEQTITKEPKDQLQPPSPSCSDEEPIATNPQSGEASLERDSPSLSQKQREEANIIRLVKTAKSQQQCLVNTASYSDCVPLPKHSTRSPDPFRRSDSPDSKIENDAHPVDVDSGEAWDESDVHAYGSARLWSGLTLAKKAFWNGTNASFTDGDQPSIVTEATPRISNMSPRKRSIVDPADIDVESSTGRDPRDVGAFIIIGRYTCTMKHMVLAGLAAMFCVGVITAVVAMVESNGSGPPLPQGVANQPISDKSDIDNATSSDVLSHSPSLSATRKTPFPTFEPSASPILLSTTVPTLAPSLEWPQLFVPVHSSTNDPTLQPSVLPIMPSSTMPTLSPSLEWPQLYVGIPSSTPDNSSNSLEPSSTQRTMLPTLSTRSRKPYSGPWPQI